MPAQKWNAGAVEPNQFKRAIGEALKDYKAYSPQVMSSPDAAVQVLIGQAIAYGRALEKAGAHAPRVIVGQQPAQRPLPGIAATN